MDPVYEALKELVRLKDLKDYIESNALLATSRHYVEYANSKPRAWAAARRALLQHECSHELNGTSMAVMLALGPLKSASSVER